MLKKRLIISLTFKDGVLLGQKISIQITDTKNFIDLWNADEIILIDVSDKGKKLSEKFVEIIKFFIKNCHLPISVGGGISSLENAQSIFDLGVEKIIMNSSTYYNSKLTSDLVTKFGSSSIIQSIDFKKEKDNRYLILVDNAKTEINQKTKYYINHLKYLWTVEIMLKSIDKDGG